MLPRLRTLIIPPDLFDDLTLDKTSASWYLVYPLRRILSLRENLPSQVGNLVRRQKNLEPYLDFRVLAVLVTAASAFTALV